MKLHGLSILGFSRARAMEVASAANRDFLSVLEIMKKTKPPANADSPNSKRKNDFDQIAEAD
jgi:hypothetical protein